ncbi:MAG: glycerophosphodiester phosphodiesterase [Bacteroidia bacterium]
MHKKPLILAHRGLVTKHQENTLPAIQAAIESPHCDGTEFDVFLTKDNKVVLFHDENLKRLTGVDRNIHDLTWEDLKTIQVLQEIEVDGGLRQYAKPLPIPLLEDVLEEIKGEDFFVDVELKAYKPSYSKRKVGGEVAKIIKRMDVMDQVVCTSFNFFMLSNLERMDRIVPSGFAYDDNMPLSAKWLNRLMETNIIGRIVHSNAVCSEHVLIDEDTVSKYHRRNMKVGTFTLYPLMPGEIPAERKAYFSNEVKRLASLGVDWIETDYPELVWADMYGEEAV